MAAKTSARLCEEGGDCAIVFARNPVAGRVKSRLWARLTPEQACRLHCASTNDTLALLDHSLPSAQKWLFFSEPLANGAAQGAIRVPASFGMGVQRGDGLGERMSDAFERAFRDGARRAVIFGSDSPTLPSAISRDAFERLNDCDLAIGPAEDGGYYLIGCRRFDRRLFEGVEWGTPLAFQQTLTNAERMHYSLAVLERWFDLDEWKDIERVIAEARAGRALPEHLAAFLKEFRNEEDRRR